MSSAEQESDHIKGDEPTSLVNRTTTVVSGRIKAIPDELLEMKEADLEKSADVHDTERKLRAAWQQEYERALRTDEPMMTQNVYKGIVTRQYFDKHIVGNSYKLAYIIKPYPEYQAQLEDMLQLGLDEMRKILKQPLKDKEGKFDHKLAAVKISLFKDLADRRRGSAAKKLEIDSKSMNLNITKEVTQTTPLQMEAIDARLRELEGGEAIAITYEDSKDGPREV